MTGAGMGLGRTVAHAARMWNYYLGGKDNYQIDRDVAEAVLAIYPGYGVKARTCRYFLLRAVRFLAAEAGVRQFLDIGTGCPTAETPTRWRSGSLRSRASSTSTTTRSSWLMPGRC